MIDKQRKVSLVITTFGRTSELARLLESLHSQTHTNFEVIVVDQNPDDRLDFIFNQDWPFALQRLHTAELRGATRGRNMGWRAAQGDTILFPDDDCWYPPNFLSHGLRLMDGLEADILAGRAVDENGRDINGRYARHPHAVNRSNVWISGIEWAMFFKMETLQKLNGYDEDIGIGAATPWQSCEAQDIMLRALDAGLKCFFDPSVNGHHEELNVAAPDSRMISKGRAYARGFGYVLRLHRYSVLTAASWISRPLVKLLTTVPTGKWRRCLYFFNVSLGRAEGYIGRTLQWRAAAKSDSERTARTSLSSRRRPVGPRPL